MATTTMTDTDQLLADFTAATRIILKWYDDDRTVTTEHHRTWLSPDAAHGMTMLRTAILNAQRLENNRPRLKSRLGVTVD